MPFVRKEILCDPEFEVANDPLYDRCIAPREVNLEIFLLDAKGGKVRRAVILDSGYRSVVALDDLDAVLEGLAGSATFYLKAPLAFARMGFSSLDPKEIIAHANHYEAREDLEVKLKDRFHSKRDPVLSREVPLNYAGLVEKYGEG